MTTRKLTVEVEEEQYVGLLNAITDFLEHTDQYKGEPEPTKNNRRAWTGDAAFTEAAETLLSVTTAAWLILDALISSASHGATVAELTGPTGLDENYIASYHRLFGKQAWRNGHRDNPISSRRREDGTVELYMRSNAVEVFSKALGALRRGEV